MLFKERNGVARPTGEGVYSLERGSERKVRSNESSREEAPKVTKSKKLCHSFSISPKGSERKGEGEVSLLTGEEREAGTVEKSLFYRVFP